MCHRLFCIMLSSLKEIFTNFSISAPEIYFKFLGPCGISWYEYSQSPIAGYLIFLSFDITNTAAIKNFLCVFKDIYTGLFNMIKKLKLKLLIQRILRLYLLINILPNCSQICQADLYLQQCHLFSYTPLMLSDQPLDFNNVKEEKQYLLLILIYKSCPFYHFYLAVSSFFLFMICSKSGYMKPTT